MQGALLNYFTLTSVCAFSKFKSALIIVFHDWSDECTWHRKTFLVQLCWHLAIKLDCIVLHCPVLVVCTNQWRKRGPPSGRSSSSPSSVLPLSKQPATPCSHLLLNGDPKRLKCGVLIYMPASGPCVSTEVTESVSAPKMQIHSVCLVYRRRSRIH